MRLKGAITVLRKEAEFMGLSFDGALAFIEKNPLAVPAKALEAFKIYKLYNV